MTLGGGMGSIEPLSTIQLIVERLAAAEGIADVVEAAVAGATDYLGATAVTVSMIDDARETMVTLAAVGLAASSTPLVSGPLPLEAGTPAYAVLASLEPLFWESQEARDRDFPQYAAFPTGQKAWAVLPLVTRGEGIGVLALGWDTPRRVGQSDRALLTVIAHQCAVALDRAQVLESEREDRATLELLSEGTRLMVSALDPDEVVTRLVRLAVPRIAPWCAVYVASGPNLRRVAIEVAAEADLTARLEANRLVPIEADTPLAEAFRSGEVLIIPRVDVEMVRSVYPAETASELMEATLRGTWTALVVPVQASGKVIGVMSLVSDAWGGSPDRRVLWAVEGLAGRAGIALANAGRFAEEHRTAVMLTRALLPEERANVVGYETATRYLPAGGPVAGDWYDVVPISEGQYLVGVGDSAGHGMEAAALMAELRSAARAFAVAGCSPEQILAGLGQLLRVTAPDELATALYALVDRPGTSSSASRDGRPAEPASVTWAAAGHPPPLHYDSAGARYLDTNGAGPLGIAAAPQAQDRTIALRPSDGLVLFTDGVVERRASDLDERLEMLRLLVEEHRCAPAEELADLIMSTMAARPEDDCCLVVIRRVPS